MTRTESRLTGDRVAQVYRSRLSTGRARLGEMLGGQIEVESTGAWVRTADGRQYFNAGGYGVFIMGARHPAVVDAVNRQLHTHPVGTRMFLEPAAAEAAEALVSVSMPGLTRVHFSGSGTEAVETAIKLARLNGRTHLVSMHGGFHGKTLGALSVTAKPMFQDPFRPLLPQVTHVRFGDIPALRTVLSELPGQACVIVEPVQGEAGVIVAPPGYLSAVSALCAEFGALLVIDEIQTGLGRCGSWWAARDEVRTADIVLTGKSLGGGVVPVSAAVVSETVYAPLDRDPFLHTSTFAAAPLAMAAVCGAIQAIDDDGLVERAAELGARLLPGIGSIVGEHFSEAVCRVRGRGLLIGIEFADAAMTADLLLALVEQHVIANHSLNSSQVVRLTPPAVIRDNEVDQLLERFERAVRTTAQRYPEA